SPPRSRRIATSACRHGQGWWRVSSCAWFQQSSSSPDIKKPAAKVATGALAMTPRSFSDLFNVAASRPANHHGISRPYASRRLASMRRVVKPSPPNRELPDMRTTGILPDRDIAALVESGALVRAAPLDADQIQPA